jgi:hypothetical protein
MFNAFEMQDHGADQVRAHLPAQPPVVVAVQSREESDIALRDALVTLSRTNGLAVIQHGARLAVIGELLVSVLAHLPQSMRADIASAFRDRIEVLMSLSDDRCLPEKYHSALLTEVNRYLKPLR